MRLLLALALIAAGCSATARPVNTFTTIPKDTTPECGNICSSIGLELSAVVVVASQVGCVCEKPGRSPGAAGASAASAGAVIAIEQARQQQQLMQQSSLHQ